MRYQTMRCGNLNVGRVRAIITGNVSVPAVILTGGIFVAERFKKAYEINLKKKVENESRVLLGKKDLSKLLEFDKMLQIETKGEN